MADIFISYSNEDRNRVSELAKTIESQGWSVWWDRKIETGKAFQDEIERELDSARFVLVIWSNHSVTSDWVRTEAEEGRRRGILVPVLLEAAKIPLAFRHLQAANLERWTFAKRSDEFDKLLLSLTNIAPRLNKSEGSPTFHWPLPYSLSNEYHYHAAIVCHEKNRIQIKLGVKNRVSGADQVYVLPVATLHIGQGQERCDVYLYEVTFHCLQYVSIEEFHSAIERYLVSLHSFSAPKCRT